jgi:hypothetical protein
MIKFCQKQKQYLDGLISLYQTHQKSLMILYSTWGIYFLFLFIRVIKFNADGVSVSHVNVWSDWPLHISMVNIFAYKNPQDWFAYHPIYADGKFTYGFLTNFISGILIRAGFSLYFALIIPSLLYVFSLLLGMYSLFNLVLKSQAKSLIAISLFFLSSGLGFIDFILHIIQDHSLNNLLNLSFFEKTLDYTRRENYQWYSGNVIVGMLLPQRAFLLGITLSIWALVGIIYVLLDNPKNHQKHQLILFISSLLSGILAITHMHSLIALFFILIPVFIVSYQQWQKLLFYYIIPTTILAITLYLIFIAGGIESSKFMTWTPGWTSQGGFWGWIMMWLKLWGLMLPVAIFGFSRLSGRSPVIKAFFFGFFLLFGVANLITFQPIPWDNSKLFLWVYLGFSGLAAKSLSLTWTTKTKWKIIDKLSVIFLVIILSFTGFLELIRLQTSNHLLITSNDDIQLGIKIREKTDPLARFLTATSHNHFIMVWAARPILMGYTAWVANFGFLYEQREADLKLMFKGGENTINLLKKYRISYVVIGPSELNDFQANEEYYQSHFPSAFQNQNYRIYDVRSLWLNSIN